MRLPSAEYARRYREKHPARVKENSKRYYDTHREQERARKRKYRVEHREQYAAYKRAAYKRACTTTSACFQSQKRRERVYRLPDGWIQSKLIEQKFTCPICNDPVNEKSHIDHNHATGTLRGILCRRCNIGLGHFRDSEMSLLRAVGYLRAQCESAA